MDIAAFSIQIIDKVFLTAQLITRTIHAYRDYPQETRELRLSIQHEVLFLDAFKTVVLDRGLIESFDRRWQEHIAEILQQLERLLLSYTKVAERTSRAALLPQRQAVHGQQQSMYLASSNSSTASGFSTCSTITTTTGSSPTPPPPTSTGPAEPKPSRSKKLLESFTRLEWALFDKDKLHKVVRDFSFWTAKLRDVLPGPVLHLPQYSDPKSYESNCLVSEAPAKVLGLSGASDIRRTMLEEIDCSAYNKLEILDNINIFHESLEGVGERRYGPCIGMLGKDREAVVLERRAMKGRDDADMQRFHQLVAMLQHPESAQFGSLRCRGYQHSGPGECTLVFDMPPRSVAYVTSLNQLMKRRGRGTGGQQQQSKPPTLDERFKVATRVARGLASFHALDWVHKSIRSTEIVFFYPDGVRRSDHQHESSSSVRYSSPYLLGFQDARAVDFSTAYDTEEDLLENLYRHPDRQFQPRSKFSKIHDIYSLGVVLLELGMWKTVEEILKDDLKAYRNRRRIPPPFEIKESLVRAAKASLGQMMGRKYRAAVLCCLNGDFEGRDDEDLGEEGSARNSLVELSFRNQVIDSLQIGTNL